MEIAIQVVWWIGLIGALILTLVILKEALLVIGTLKDIHQLSEYIREAAQGIAAHMTAASRLAGLTYPARDLHEATKALPPAISSVEQKLDSLISDFSR